MQRYQQILNYKSFCCKNFVLQYAKYGVERRGDNSNGGRQNPADWVDDIFGGREKLATLLFWGG